MDAVAAHAALKDLASSIPDLTDIPNKDTSRWIAQLVAVLHKTGRWAEKTKVQLAADLLGGSFSSGPSTRINNVLYQAIAELELELPANMQGAFLTVGSPFDATIALSSVIKLAKQNILIVDAYMDDTILSKFALMADENVGIALLTDESGMRPNLIPAAKAWTQQFGAKRPLKIQVTKPRILHDRLIVCDDDVWVVTQSLKDLAVRSPASLTKVDRELSSAKIEAYTDIWTAGRDALATP
ncbi:hypothetical protein [Sphingomonas sp. Leaf4]|uniref:hypothetical protein n=1 Tax=Sphingomonas sp. Leaf4 TaxID=2876553 RepID=UPI001E2ADDD3|nr:hypothetical protein [Sphingomonas sp. Leaf4]